MIDEVKQPSMLFKIDDVHGSGCSKRSWSALKISKQLSEILKKEFNFPTMTPVQSAAIPLMLENKDVIVEAKTGSGKTLAFLIPLVEMLIRRDKKTPIQTHEVLVIVLTPTRELANQIHQELRKILRHPILSDDRTVSSQLIVGGKNVASNIDKYMKFGGNVIVATPGRLSAIMEMKDNELSSCIRKNLAYLVFDEADQLLSVEFERDLSSILNYLPKQRRTSLFSATQTKDVEELIKSGMRNPVRVDLNKLISSKDASSTSLQMPDKLANHFVVCNSYIEKLATMVAVIKSEDHKKVLIFMSTCAQIDYFAACLEKEFSDNKTCLMKLHRRLKSKRKSIFKKFKSSKRSVLLATDILSRGIDVNDISLVIHVDLPASPECYVHRSGRSGHQLEKCGKSILLIEKYEIDYIEMCRRRQVILKELDLGEIHNTIQELSVEMRKRLQLKASNDEAFKISGLQAFVSYVRFYTSKLCLRELLAPKLPYVQLARSYALCRLPKMPELKRNFRSLVSEFESGEIKE